MKIMMTSFKKKIYFTEFIYQSFQSFFCFKLKIDEYDDFIHIIKNK